MSFIEIHDLTVKRSQQIVLHGLHLSIEQSNIIAIIGPSGSGKTSLLRCLNRLESYAGTIQLGGQDIASLPVLDLRRRVGMIFQKTAAFSGTVADNIAFGATLVGEDLAEEQICDWMEQVSLPTELMHRDAQELSGGQEQRLAIARALANQPDVLLLDEPSSALDPIATHHVEESLLRLRDTYHLTMLWVSHSVEQARRVADQVVLLNEGRVLSVDTVAAMLDPETGDPRALAFEQGDEIGLHQE